MNIISAINNAKERRRAERARKYINDRWGDYRKTLFYTLRAGKPLPLSRPVASGDESWLTNEEKTRLRKGYERILEDMGGIKSSARPKPVSLPTETAPY